MRKQKSHSSLWIKTKGREFEKFYWQRGYGAFSVSPSAIEIVKNYILNQEEYHKNRTFEDEYREFLREHNVEYDERYVWD